MLVKAQSREAMSRVKAISTDAVVYGVWLAMSLVAISYVTRYGSDVPSWDDWDMVPTMTGNQPVTAEWLWSQHNEHRVPLARIVSLGVYRWRADFRLCMFLNVALMAGLALMVMWAIRRLRGTTAYTDAFIPIALLNLAQGLNFIWAWQIEFFVSTALVIATLLIISTSPQPIVGRAAILYFACLVLLVGSGAHGLAVVPALALWLGICPLITRPSPMLNRRTLYLHSILAGCVMSAAGLYFIGFERVPYFPTSRSVIHTLKTGLQFLTLSFGSSIRTFWPAAGIFVALLCCGAVALLLRVVVHCAPERGRALGLLFFGVAMLSLSLAVGLGREGFEPRYITLSVPILCWFYLIATLYGKGPSGTAIRASLLVVSCICLWPNSVSGIVYGRDLRQRLSSFERDMIGGTPPYRLIRSYHEYLEINEQVIADYLPMLRQAGIGSFRFLKDDPPFREISLSPNRAELVPSQADQAATKTRSDFSTVVFSLDNPMYAVGIRLRYKSESEGRPPFIEVSWRTDTEAPYEKSDKFTPHGDRFNWQRGSWVRIAQPETDLTIWNCSMVRYVRVIVSQPSQAQMTIGLLVPES